MAFTFMWQAWGMRTVAGLLVAVALIAGCGGSGGSDSQSPTLVEAYCQVEQVMESNNVYWRWTEVETRIWSDGSITTTNLGDPTVGVLQDRTRWYIGAPCAKSRLP